MNYIVLVELNNLDDDSVHRVIGPFRTYEKAESTAASLKRTADGETSHLGEDDRNMCMVNAWVQRISDIPRTRTEIREFVQSFDTGDDGDE